MKNWELLDDTHLLEKWIKQYMLGCITQVEICKKKKSIIDGADKVEILLITDAISSNVLSFLKESTRLLKLHIDGADFFAKSYFSFILKNCDSMSEWVSEWRR